MSGTVKRILIVLIVAAFVVMDPIGLFSGNGNVYADVGAIEDGEDISYDKNGGVLASMGFDTSKMPATYDPDATTNPYGSDVSMLNEVKEAVWFHLGSTPAFASKTLLYGHNKPLNGQYGDFSSDPITNTGWAEGEFLGPNDFVSAVKCDINGDGRDSALALVYTHFNSDRPNDTDRNIYMLLYDPVSGTHSEPFVKSFDTNGVFPAIMSV